MGGFHERMVGTAKRCLRKELGSARIMLSTLLKLFIQLSTQKWNVIVPFPFGQ